MGADATGLNRHKVMISFKSQNHVESINQCVDCQWNHRTGRNKNTEKSSYYFYL